MSTPPPPHYTLTHRPHLAVQAVPPAASSSSTPAAPSTSGHEFQETTSVCLEWRLTGLKTMYESTRGEQKSKCIKSAVFGDADNLWEVLWYPNAGTSTQTAGDHVSLYLSCVPTAQERDSSIQNKWVRKGLWWFKFEIRPIPSPGDATPSKDASDHTFAVKTANWGWQAFAKRDALFQHPSVLQTDSCMIICTIQAQPQAPAGVWVVPKELVSSVGSLLDDPLYSDVEFVIPSRRGSRATPRSIFASKKLLRRCDYFNAMFHGGFKEVEGTYEEVSRTYESDDDISVLSDSDMDEEMILEDVSSYSGDAHSHIQSGSIIAPERERERDMHLTTTTSRNSSIRRPSISADRERREDDTSTSSSSEAIPHENTGTKDEEVGNVTIESEEGHQLKIEEKEQKKEPSLISSTNTKRSSKPSITGSRSKLSKVAIGPKKTRVVIRDAAWSTWWNVLYWIYTDIIYFAPLSSSFEHQIPRRTSTSTVNASSNLPSSSTAPDAENPRSRSEWIQRWMYERDIDSPPHPLVSLYDEDEEDEEEESYVLGPRPVSAKAVYRLADKLDLPALKLRAFQHICAGLTAGNVPAEVFSRFSSTYEDVRKVQVAFFLKHWSEIKKSETMTQIWQQIRNGKHVGFEEVWPLIVSQLDFRPAT
uniref:MATH domain-containing protein n=1 Tax=Kwoniella bestiolae CBS 10118 TaxID=1296100 RepID=A0A1B9G5R9_9TREE|nr:hypothetical protein I302_04058 [Kwoniella bestiolae CBS 10118]OCF26375.1 hypothetical protein I302_04058 [Kwoniella bestiolae CBS 10118]